MRHVAVVSLVIACLSVVPALTVTNGQPDGTAHPYVGVAIQPIPDMPGFVSVCSGSALSATVFLTAAHCFDPSSPVFVSYAEAPTSFAQFTSGTFIPYDGYCPGCGPGLQGFDSGDVAVITLDAPVNPGEFVNLPEAGLVDGLPMQTPVTVVGYGVNGFVRGGGVPGEVFLFRRYQAPSLLVQSNNVSSDEYIKLTANLAKGKGGICFGDSGGPDVLEGTGAGNDTVLAVNSYVTNSNCSGVTYSNRVDLPGILEFITTHLD